MICTKAHIPYNALDPLKLINFCHKGKLHNTALSFILTHESDCSLNLKLTLAK